MPLGTNGVDGGAGLAGPSQPGDRIPGVVGTFPSTTNTGPAGSPVAAPTQSQPQAPRTGDPAGASDSQDAPPTLEQWKAYQASENAKEQRYKDQLAAAEARAQQVEQNLTQETLKSRVQSRAIELYNLAMAQPNVDPTQAEAWAIRKAQEEVSGEVQTEQDKKDAEKFRTSTKTSERFNDLKAFVTKTIADNNIDGETFKRVCGDIRPSDPDYKLKVLEALNKDARSQASQTRYNAAEHLVNQTAFPGASTGSAEGGFVPNKALRAKPEYTKILNDAWKRFGQ